MILGSDVMADKYCMYLRKSRKDDDIKSESIEETLARHEKALWELAERMGLTVECVHREVVSGETIDARPVMQQLRELLTTYSLYSLKWELLGQ